MRERIWRDLRNSRFYLEYLGLHIQVAKKKNKNLETWLLISAIVSLTGLVKFAEYSLFWSIPLWIITAVRMLKSRFTVSEEEIATWRSVYNFYLDHYKELEKLWYKYDKDKISEAQAEKLFDTLNDEEKLMIKINKHDKIQRKEPMGTKADEITIDYLKHLQ